MAAEQGESTVAGGGGRLGEKEQQIDPLSISLWCGLGPLLKTSPYVQKGKKRGYQWGKNEKVRKWGEEVRTRDMAPSYKDPTVQESHCLPLDWVLGKTKACIWEKKEGRGEKSHKMAGVGFGAAIGSHDKPNSETHSLFLISTQCLHPSTFPLLLPPSPF